MCCIRQIYEKVIDKQFLNKTDLETFKDFNFRLSKHPVIRKDAMFKAFLHEKDVAKTLKPLVTMKGAMNNMKRRLNLFRSKMVVKEKDPWFQVNIGI